jgi:hypothetical protein
LGERLQSDDGEAAWGDRNGRGADIDGTRALHTVSSTAVYPK